MEKKCLLASAGTHTLLLFLLFAAPVMVVSKKKDLNLPVLTFLPSIATDQMAVGGGSPLVTEPPALIQAAPPPQPIAPIEPPAVSRISPQKVEPIAEPEVEPVQTVKQAKSERDQSSPKALAKTGTDALKQKRETSKTEAEDADTHKKPDSWRASFTPSSRNKTLNKRNAEAKARADAAARALAAQRAFAAKVQRSLQSLGSSFSPGTSIEVPGAGGALFANYKLIVEAMYQQAWISPEEANEDSAVARAKVVIRRDGTVMEAWIIKPSGIRAMDQSVERALELKFIAPFPEDSKDLQRLFYINFDLKTKRLLG